MTDNEMKKREEIVMKLRRKCPSSSKDMVTNEKQVMYATATKMQWVKNVHLKQKSPRKRTK